LAEADPPQEVAPPAVVDQADDSEDEVEVLPTPPIQFTDANFVDLSQLDDESDDDEVEIIAILPKPIADPLRFIERTKRLASEHDARRREVKRIRHFNI
jgi:hypothetical protein